MLQWILIAAVVGQACGIKIPLNQFKAEVYREPPIYGPIRTTAVELEYVEQRVDNFDPTNDATWQMVKLIVVELLKLDTLMQIYCVVCIRFL